MNEVQTVKSMVLVFDTSVQVSVALSARMALNGRLLVNDGELVRVCGDADFFPWDHGDNRKPGARRLPAFAAATGVVMQGLSVDSDLNLVGWAQALQRAAGKIDSRRFYPVIQCRVKFYIAHSVSPDPWGDGGDVPGQAPRNRR